MKFGHFAPLDKLRQPVGVYVGFCVEGLPEFGAEVLVELAVLLQRFGLIALKSGQKLLVHEQAAVQHAAREQRRQPQRVQDFDAEGAGCGVEDAKHRRQHHENETGGKQAFCGLTDVVGDGH
ncbi:hypothetical protein MUN81_10480 [Hymenobacter sp. 5317J-9]|uniref:hypothetical protein n=1 Tax=Hymenobacter sp. 5317J-9 TaxID=2932250 RepID=UPI001FD6CDCA|nr:hypothetical protein [Hymenobacter sp. 5317J-9]UOQ99905.1 hypothetical protein MUN81_10480 [Hymenobacter sp. 5317J-9]